MAALVHRPLLSAQDCKGLNAAARCVWCCSPAEAEELHPVFFLRLLDLGPLRGCRAIPYSNLSLLYAHANRFRAEDLVRIRDDAGRVQSPAESTLNFRFETLR
jgi:hypothetical protein